MDSSESPHNTPYRPRNANGSANRIPMQVVSAAGGAQRSPSASLRASPYSPFPFGLPIQSSNRSILSPGSLEQQEGMSRDDSEPKAGFSSENDIGRSGLHVLRGRVRAQDVYGGKHKNKHEVLGFMDIYPTIFGPIMRITISYPLRTINVWRNALIFSTWWFSRFNENAKSATFIVCQSIPLRSSFTNSCKTARKAATFSLIINNSISFR